MANVQQKDESLSNKKKPLLNGAKWYLSLLGAFVIERYVTTMLYAERLSFNYYSRKTDK